MSDDAKLEDAVDRIKRELEDAAARGGKRTFASGAIGYGHAPFIAPEAWWHTTFAPLDATGLDEAQQAIGRELPAAYRSFLSWSNGIALFGGALNVFGRRWSYERSLEARQPFDLDIPNVYERPANAPEDAVFVAVYTFDGSLVYVTANGEAFLCHRRDATSVLRWSSLAEFLLAEVSRIAEQSAEENVPVPPPR